MEEDDEVVVVAEEACGGEGGWRVGECIAALSNRTR